MIQFNINWLEQAFFLAQKAALEDEVPVGAIVIYEQKIIGRGYNRREQSQDPLAHAEILAIREAASHLGSWRLNPCQLIVTLEPCLMCLAACQQARLREVIYGATDPKGGALSLGYRFHEDPRLNHRLDVTHCEFEPGSLILKDFFKKKRLS